MALCAGTFPEKLGHSACSQPACAGKDWCITQPIGQRCTDDQPTIKGRTSATLDTLSHYSPVFIAPLAINSLRRRVQFFSAGVSTRRTDSVDRCRACLVVQPALGRQIGPGNAVHCRTCAGRCCLSGPERLHDQQHFAICVPMCRGSWNFLPATGVVEPAVEIPDRRFGGGRARCDQFSGQPWRLHRAECRPVDPRCDRKHDCTNALSGGVPRSRRPDDFLRASGDWRRHPELAVAA